MTTTSRPNSRRKRSGGTAPAEPARPSGSVRPPHPYIRIRGLHIEGLGPIRKLDWPADGLGWRGGVPEGMILVGGGNGSGKTLLLRFLARLLGWPESGRLRKDVTGERPSGKQPPPIELWLPKPEAPCWVDVEIGMDTGRTGCLRYRLLPANWKREADATQEGWDFEFLPDGQLDARHRGSFAMEFHQAASKLPEGDSAAQSPSILLIQSEGRMYAEYENVQRAVPRPDLTPRFLRVWHRAADYGTSIPALLTGLHYLDLHSKERGTPTDHVRPYFEVFEQLTAGSKRMAWTDDGEPEIEITATGLRHPLSRLSSGEKQLLVQAVELERYWRPGSLILIDEPEISLHDSLQYRFANWLMKRAAEQNSQIIAATHSSALFGSYGSAFVMRGGDQA